MAIFGNDFTYNGTSLKSINQDYVMVSFSEPDGVAHQRRINQSEFSNDNYIQHYYGHIADTPLEFDITVAKCSSNSMTRADANVLSDWLFATSEPKVLYITPRQGDNVMYENVDFIGAFTQMSYESGDAAITFHFVNISGYAFSKPYTVTANTATAQSVSIPWNGSKAGEIIYPVVRVTPTADGTLVISLPNSEDFSVTMTVGNAFYISDRNMYNSDGTLYSFENLNTFNWPYLVDGTNVWGLSGTGTAEITIETRNLITTGY